MKIYVGIIQNSYYDRCDVYTNTNKKEITDFLFKSYKNSLKEEPDADKNVKFNKKEFMEALEEESAYMQCPAYHINFELHTFNI